jgi:hypothetical protein
MKEDHAIGNSDVRLGDLEQLICEPPKILAITQVWRAMKHGLEESDWYRLVAAVERHERAKLPKRCPSKRWVIRGQCWRSSDGVFRWTWPDAKESEVPPSSAIPIVLVLDPYFGALRPHRALELVALVFLGIDFVRHDLDPNKSIRRRLHCWKATAQRGLQLKRNNPRFAQVCEELDSFGVCDQEDHTALMEAYEAAKDALKTDKAFLEMNENQRSAYSVAELLWNQCRELENLFDSRAKSRKRIGKAASALRASMAAETALNCEQLHDRLETLLRMGLVERNMKLHHRRGRQVKDPFIARIFVACEKVYSVKGRRPKLTEILNEIRWKIQRTSEGDFVCVPKAGAEDFGKTSYRRKSFYRIIERWNDEITNPPLEGEGSSAKS